MSDDVPPVEPVPWFANRELPVLFFRINRRRFEQLRLPLGPERDPSVLPPFFDHLVECLLVGEEVVTSGRGVDRTWRVGNRHISQNQDYLTARLGFETPEVETHDMFDADALEWRTTVQSGERVVTTPFAVIEASRYLCIAKPSSIADRTFRTVFEDLLNRGERQRGTVQVEWAVEPLLDEASFARWLEQVRILDKVTFNVKLPNPDAADSFRQLTEHMEAAGAGELDHTLRPRREDRGLSKDLEGDPISQGLMEMAKLSFAQIKAKGRDAAGKVLEYSQKNKVRRQRTKLPSTYDEAEAVIAQLGIDEGVPTASVPAQLGDGE